MDEMNEAEWRKAEKRQPGKTYIDPEVKLLSIHRDPTGRWAIACGVAVVIAGVATVWSALPLIPFVMEEWKGNHQSVAVYDASFREAYPGMIPYTPEVDKAWKERCKRLRPSDWRLHC